MNLCIKRRTVKLVLAPHPKLPAAHRRAVALDYGMVEGTATLECRQAFLFYVLRHMRLDLAAADTKPEEQQVVLKVARSQTRAGRALDWLYVEKHCAPDLSPRHRSLHEQHAHAEGARLLHQGHQRDSPSYCRITTN